jgi:hypothetical protein
MDDKLVWTDTVSTFALHGVSMPEALQRMWGHLRAAVVYFMRYQANQHQCEHIDAAQDHLLKYGRLVQRTWNMQELMTFNLHTCMLHVPEQVKLCGPLAFAAEWWLERLMQVFKRVTKYRCTRHPETTAVQHWLTVAALDNTRLSHPTVTALLDRIRAGRISADQDTTAGRSWLSGTVRAADSKVNDHVKEAFESVERNHGGDGMRVTLTLNSAHIGCNMLNQVGQKGRGIPLMRLSTAQTATIKGGNSTVRTKAKSSAKQDWHALVPYTTEELSPAAEAAEVSASTAVAIAEAAKALPCTSATPSLLEVLAADARTAAEAAQRHVAASEQTGGYNEAAQEVRRAVSRVAQIAEAALGQLHDTATTSQVAQAMQQCKAAAIQLPEKCAAPTDPAPPSMLTLLEVEHLVKWEQEVDGRTLMRRLAIGIMKPLQPVANQLLQFETVFCDGSRGRRKRVPTMLTVPPGAAGFKYAVFLDQIECAMVKATDSTGHNCYVPVNRSGMKG